MDLYDDSVADAPGSHAPGLDLEISPFDELADTFVDECTRAGIAEVDARAFLANMRHAVENGASDNGILEEGLGDLCAARGGTARARHIAEQIWQIAVDLEPFRKVSVGPSVSAHQEAARSGVDHVMHNYGSGRSIQIHMEDAL